MELTDQQLVDIEKKMLALPGVNAGHESSLLIEDGWGKNGCETYIKCMSDHGITDDQNGNAIAAYLVTMGCVIKHDRPRSMMVQTADLVRLFVRLKTSDAFIAAKAILDKPGSRRDLDYHSFICHCLDTAAQSHPGNTAFECAKRIIHQRLGFQQVDPDWRHDVYSYLSEVVGVPANQLTFNNLQAYRHRWLDALIVEYQQMGC